MVISVKFAIKEDVSALKFVSNENCTIFFIGTIFFYVEVTILLCCLNYIST